MKSRCLDARKLLALLLLFSLLAVSVVAAYAADGSSGGGLFGTLSDIGNFIAHIFVPESNYFHNKLSELNDRLNEKLGGVAYLYLMLNGFFKTLNSAPEAGLAFTLPSNFLFPGHAGFTVNLFYNAKPYLSMLRAVLTAACCLFTAICCYHKVRSFFKE